MKGSFKKRGTTWYYWAELPPGPDGRRRQKSAGGFRTRKEAETAFAALRDSVRTGSYVSATKLTLGQYLTGEWLPGVRASLRPTTWQHYAGNVEAHRSRQSTPKVAALKYPAIAAMDGRCEGAESTAIRS